jgi:hypothetical protein
VNGGPSAARSQATSIKTYSPQSGIVYAVGYTATTGNEVHEVNTVQLTELASEPKATYAQAYSSVSSSPQPWAVQHTYSPAAALPPVQRWTELKRAAICAQVANMLASLPTLVDTSCPEVVYACSIGTGAVTDCDVSRHRWQPLSCCLIKRSSWSHHPFAHYR